MKEKERTCVMYVCVCVCEGGGEYFREDFSHSLTLCVLCLLRANCQIKNYVQELSNILLCSIVLTNKKLSS